MQQLLQSEEDLSKYPCLTADRPAEHCSDRYRQVNTMDVVEAMRERGFGVNSVQASRSRTKAGATGKHLIRMSRIGAPLAIGQTRPELVIVNSHDASSSCRLLLGVFRMVCSNGLVTGVSHEDTALRHVGDVREQVDRALRTMAGQEDQLADTIGRWQDRKLSESQRHKMAERALLLRLGVDPRTEHLIPVVQSARRYADRGDDLWSTFNRLQENLVERPASYRVPGKRRKQSLRRLEDPDKVLRLNRELWDLAEEFERN